MKIHSNRTLTSYSFLVLAAALTAAASPSQEIPGTEPLLRPSPTALVVEPGSVLRCRLEEGRRFHSTEDRPRNVRSACSFRWNGLADSYGRYHRSPRRANGEISFQVAAPGHTSDSLGGNEETTTGTAQVAAAIASCRHEFAVPSRVPRSGHALRCDSACSLYSAGTCSALR